MSMWERGRGRGRGKGRGRGRGKGKGEREGRGRGGGEEKPNLVYSPFFLFFSHFQVLEQSSTHTPRLLLW